MKDVFGYIRHCNGRVWLAATTPLPGDPGISLKGFSLIALAGVNPDGAFDERDAAHLHEMLEGGFSFAGVFILNESRPGRFRVESASNLRLISEAQERTRASAQEVCLFSAMDAKAAVLTTMMAPEDEPPPRTTALEPD